MNNQEIRTIFVSIANGIGNHGSFLTYFAKTLLQADAENFALLSPIARELIHKYNLNTDVYKCEPVYNH